MCLGVARSMVAARRRAMHEMFFGIKRVHLRTLHWSRKLLGGRQLTPARFDMMRIIDAHPYGVPQRNLQYLLGVTAQTVSRMLRSLEKLGFVARERISRNARALRVRISDVGGEVLSDAMEGLVFSGIAERFALRAFAIDMDPDTAGPPLRALRHTLSAIRRRYGDTTPFEEPWRGGELPYPPTIVDEAAA